MNEVNSNVNLSKNQPIVSVIVATYRRDVTLVRALHSLIQQTYDFLEIIVVDDNADELWNNKVCNIINNFKAKCNRTIIYVRNEINKGSAESRNVGIRLASGTYITFLDDDDIYLPKKIENQLKHMSKENSDYSITDLYLYDESGRLVEKRNRKYIKQFDKDSLLKYHLMYHMTGTGTMMFRKDYLLDIGGFPPINVGDEFYLMQKAIEAGGKFSYLPTCDIRAYIHTKTDGLSSGQSKIDGENELYRYKSKYYHKLSNSTIRYINMRHYAVLAFAEFRRNNVIKFIKYSLCSFISSPYQAIKLILSRKI